MTVYEIISVLLALLGLLGGVVGFIRAVAADRRSAAAAAESADARSDAAAALKQSAAATERIAAAVELLASRQASTQGSVMAERASPELIQAELIQAELSALIGPREVQWTVEHRLPASSYRLRNIGSIAAHHVSLLGGTPDPDADLAVLPPGTAIAFGVDPGQHSRAVEVTWRDDGSATPTRLALPLPPASERPAS
jgi:hypothetical protein